MEEQEKLTPQPLVREQGTKLELHPQFERMDAVAAERFIDNLVELRARMVPKVSADPTDIGRRTIVREPEFVAGSITGSNDKSLIFRHDGLGWIRFDMSETKVRALVFLLTSLLPKDRSKMN